jgi:hypothetical protein
VTHEDKICRGYSDVAAVMALDTRLEDKGASANTIRVNNSHSYYLYVSLEDKGDRMGVSRRTRNISSVCINEMKRLLPLQARLANKSMTVCCLCCHGHGMNPRHAVLPHAHQVV